MGKKTGFNAKISEVEGKIPSISGLATTSALTAAEKKLPDVKSLLRKIDCAAEIDNIKNDYVTNAALNDRHKDLIQKRKYNNSINQLKERIDGLERYASYFRGKNYFNGNDGAQNTLVFQTMQKHFNLSNVDQISKWKAKGLSNQYLHLVGTVDDIVLSKPIKPVHVMVKRKGALIQDDNDIIAVGPIENIHIIYKTPPKTINSNCLFGLFIWCN